MRKKPRLMIFHKVLLTFLIGFQIVGPSWFGVLFLSEAKAQESPASQARIAGLRGVVTVQPDRPDQPGYSPKYRDSLSAGDVITTEEESVAELLLDHQGLITLQEYSEAMLGKKPDGSFSVDLHVGAAEWSLPQQGTGQAALSFSTPNIRGKTTGGLITAAVQSTLSETAEELRPKRSFVVRTSLQAQSPQAGKVALLETFCVKEGTLEVDYPGTQSGAREQKEVPVGQCVGFFNGALRAMGNEYQIADWRTICAVGQHCEIPEAAKKLIKKKQMAQALALERALVGSDTEDGDVDEQVILATTAANFGGSGSAPAIVPPTTTPPCSVPGQCIITELPSTGGGGGELTPGQNIQIIGTLFPPGGIAGGPGLLTFLDGNFRADKELLLADSGFLADAPHLGKAPQNNFAVKDLGTDGGGSVSNQQLPLQFSSFNQAGTPSVQLGVESSDRQQQAQQLSQFARSASIDPDNILASVPESGATVSCESLLDCFEIILTVGKNGTFSNPDADAGVDGTIQVRSASMFDPTPGANQQVTLNKGVVLVNTHVGIATQQKTSQSFSGLDPGIGSPIHGTAVSVLGEPGNPALLTVEDRVLAILDGSRIEPASAGVTTALLAILDGTLVGPTATRVIGQDQMGNDIRRGIPVIEMIDGSAEVTTGVFVGSTATAGQTGTLDQALLNASSPLIAMIRSTMTTEGDFGRVAGRNAKFQANLMAGDALVRLDASSMVVNGNLFTVAAGGSMIVDGTLVFLNEGSSLSLNGGVLVNVQGAGSSFSLSNGPLVEFGSGPNVLNIANNLCAAGGCISLFANSDWRIAGDVADVSVSPTFNPFGGLGSAQNSVNVGPNSAILSVQGGGKVTLQ